MRFALALFSVACRRAPAESAPASALDRFLPDAVGSLSAAPFERGERFVRRRYERGALHIEVTIARAPEISYERWLEMSKDEPPVALDLPGGAGLGFYDCTGAKDKERCDVHVHLANGHHVEVNSGGTARRSDLDTFLAGLPVRSLAGLAGPAEGER
jgi:hypothetical protein